MKIDYQSGLPLCQNMKYDLCELWYHPIRALLAHYTNTHKDRYREVTQFPEHIEDWGILLSFLM